MAEVWNLRVFGRAAVTVALGLVVASLAESEFQKICWFLGLVAYGRLRCLVGGQGVAAAAHIARTEAWCRQLAEGVDEGLGRRRPFPESILARTTVKDYGIAERVGDNADLEDYRQSARRIEQSTRETVYAWAAVDGVLAFLIVVSLIT
jgi:hypothetical protein